MAQKPSIPKGTRDFNPVQMKRRNYIFDIIRSTFISFGYQAIETPAMETLDTLMGKYGEEGDRLIFKVLNSGHYSSKIPKEALMELVDSEETDPGVSRRLTTSISEKALRYDLTVPFARYVVQHRNDITFPFKRFQLQPVWRADRPQKGRYREFYQCDVDVIGSNSLLNELELIQIIDQVFLSLKTRALIKLNNRKILTGIAEVIGYPEKIIDITTAIDKIDKIGLLKVNEELISKGLPKEAIDKLQPILNLSGDHYSQLNELLSVLSDSDIGLQGISEIKSIFNMLDQLNLNTRVELDLTLARGLNYYTGAIIEVKSLDLEIGSICGGGRYDNLTGIFGLPDVSGVGISFGADRIYDVLDKTNGFPDHTATTTQVIFMNFGEEEIKSAIQFASELRSAGISTEIYPDQAKMKKQMSYANNHQIPIVVIAGKNELEKEQLEIKNMKTGEQVAVPFTEMITYIKDILS